MRIAFAVLVLLLVAAAGTTAMLRSRGEAAADRTAPFAVAAEHDLTPRIVATGSVRLTPGAKVEVGARASGVVRRLAVRQGSIVHKGDVIAELDDREIRLRLVDAEARAADLTESRAKADDDLRRLEPLATAGFVSPQDVFNARTAARQAAAKLTSAIAQANLARVQLDYMTIRAPVEGVVASVTTHEGETVAASFATPTFVTLVDLSRLECVALVDETDIGRVAPGDKAEFTVDAYPSQVFQGDVVRIAPDATILSGVVDYETTIRVTNGLGMLRPQMTANVIIKGPSRRALVIPTTALRQASDGPYVWIRAADRVNRREVRIGPREADFTQIISGLQAGDTVLTGRFPEVSS